MGARCHSLHSAVRICPISQSGSKPGGALPADKAGSSPLSVPVLGSHFRRCGPENKCCAHFFAYTADKQHCPCLFVYLYAEARGLVRSLLQPDPTVRLTAGQTLLHPWVEAMAAVCRQGALKDETHANAVNNTAEQDRVQRLHQNNASEKSERTKKRPIRPGLHTPDCSRTGSASREVSWPEILDLAPEGSNTACNAGRRVNLRSYLSGPITQMEPLPQIKSQSQQNSQSHLTLHTPASANQRQPVSGHLMSTTHPSTNPATASSSRPPHPQNSSCSLYNRNSSTVHKTD